MTNHKHTAIVKDSDARFIIEPITRQIRNTTRKKVLGQYDHNSERFGFSCPRYIEEHDMSVCDRVEIHFENIEKKNKTNIIEGIYYAKDLKVSEENSDTVNFSWLIEDDATQLVGSLNFMVSFVCANDAEKDYSWSTDWYKGITILKGSNITEEIVKDHPDIYDALRLDILEEVNAEIERSGKIKTINGKEPDENGNIELDFEGTVKYSELQELTDEEKEQARANIGFANSLISALEGLGLINPLKDADGKYILDGDGAILLLPKDKEETKAIVFETLLELDVLPVLYDSDGSMLTDENGAILFT